MRACRTEGWFSDGDPWPCTAPERLALLKKLESRFPPLESAATETRVGIGVATGADAVYVTRDTDIVEQDRLLPLALTDESRRVSSIWSGHYLVNPWDEHGLVELPGYPKLKAYYEAHQLQLQKRHSRSAHQMPGIARLIVLITHS